MNRPDLRSLHCCVLTFAASLLGGITSVQGAEPLSFNRDVRPILSEYCLHCHGPDRQTRQAELRLDLAEDALRRRDDHAVIVPGQVEQSTLIARLTTTDADEKMPPADQRQLNAQQIATLKRWVAEGAKYEPHWAFVPPRRPSLPQVNDPAWVRQRIDQFVLAKLDSLKLKPNGEADRPTLIRRLSFDLIGLPATPEETATFVNDTSPEAYERVVDRLLASPRFGERFATPWLDAARYADTNGYQTDGPRVMWRWRDWVIDAFNANQPFDRFTIEQLAGDRLPDPTLDQLIATGFNRNHRGNAEGGIIPEEFRLEYVADRVETTATVWLGLTMGCARCHDHKFDPLAQREFYQMFAYFNQVPEMGKVLRDSNSPPMVLAPTSAMRERLDHYAQQLAEQQQRIEAAEEQLQVPFETWQRQTDRGASADTVALTHRVAFVPLDEFGKLRAEDGMPKFEPARVGNGARLDGLTAIEFSNKAVNAALDFHESQSFSFGAWVKLDAPRAGQKFWGGTVLAKMETDANHRGYGLHIENGQVHVDLSGRLLDDSIQVVSHATLEPNRWYHLLATYDGSKFAAGVTLHIDGQQTPTRTLLDTLSNPIKNDEPLRIGARGVAERFAGVVDDVQLFDRELTADQSLILSTSESISQLLAIPHDQRTPAARLKLWEYYVQHHAPESYRELLAKKVDLAEAALAYEKQLPTVMVMQDRAEPRPTHLLLRGVYDRPGERVEGGIPACLPPLPKDARPDRLALAHWLTSPEHPLTARVAVNRYWQLLFGIGLVKTTDDFGSQGEPPSHPELLDDLALDFIASGWDLKRLLKQIVTSATYRQSSRVTPAQVAQDPENRLLARGARFRLSAEMMRDQALHIAGLLDSRLGGPSVKPYQPAGLWEELAAAPTPYVQDHGSDLYRRGLYTFWKRTVSPPSLSTFDAAGRETCVVRTARTNTPLQALNLLNDPTYVEASRKLAERVLLESPASSATTDELVSRLMQHILGRVPTAGERDVLRRNLTKNVDYFENHLPAARKLTAVGESLNAFARGTKQEVATQAALATLASLLFNLDEAITRE